METENTPIVTAIQEKETELKVKILEAKTNAESLLINARREAADILARAREKADRETQKLISEALARAEAEAVEISESADKYTSSLERLSKRNFAQAVGLITRAVCGRELDGNWASRARSNQAKPAVSTDYQHAAGTLPDGGKDAG